MTAGQNRQQNGDDRGQGDITGYTAFLNSENKQAEKVQNFDFSDRKNERERSQSETDVRLRDRRTEMINGDAQSSPRDQNNSVSTLSGCKSDEDTLEDEVFDSFCKDYETRVPVNIQIRFEEYTADGQVICFEEKTENIEAWIGTNNSTQDTQSHYK
ncbi:unnamed protein product [Mytilus edulis]|uniref:Uncharacterized protein n=1 Tax=Mytilus edulis TaxID=6550 RepID=A0A8S3QC48_MYTED|nr:unnamed protein product [Mytilus edulis]